MATVQPRLWQLNSCFSTVILHAKTDSDVPAIVWFGERLQQQTEASSMSLLTDLPLPMAKRDNPLTQNIFPQFADDTEISPALKGHRDGQFFAHRFHCQRVTQDKSSLHIELADDAAQLIATVMIALDEESGVLSISNTLTNIGTEVFQVDWLASASLPVPGHFAECVYLHGRWGLEFQTHRQALGPGTLLLENQRGRTSHELYPGVVVGEAGFS